MDHVSVSKTRPSDSKKPPPLSGNFQNDVELHLEDEEEDLTISDHVRVVVRCRPLDTTKETNSSSVLNVNGRTNRIDLSSPTFGSKNYSFHCVADDSKDQYFIFRNAGKPIVDCALAGFNGAIVA